MTRMTLRCTHVDDTITESRLPAGVAWIAARAIAVESLADVELISKRGVAKFDCNGAGFVYWANGTTSNFGPNMTVCLA